MKFSYNILQEYFKEKLPKPEKLVDILTMHSFEVEGIEKINDDYIFNIDVLPNRIMDAGGYLGIAREIYALLAYQKLISKKSFKTLNFNSQILKKLQIAADKSQKNKLFEIKIENYDLCPRYIGVIMEGVEAKESPEWLKTRLKNLGINSINNLVDAVNYAMLETNQPLHIFDFDKIEGNKIIARNSSKGESIITLDNKKYDLDEDILIIADEREPLAIAGIKGGKKAEVGFNTKRILIEAANFNRSVVRGASQKLNLKTDASLRFSAGISLELAEIGILKAMELIKDFAGGRIVSAYDECFAKSTPKIVKLEFEKIEKLLGFQIPINDVKNILELLGFEFSYVKNIFKIDPPFIRQDIETKEDVIEEIVRVYGYEKIKASAPKTSIINLEGENQDNKLIFEETLKNFFVGQGFSEMYSYSFIGEKDFLLSFENTKLAEKGFESKKIIELQNPVNPESKYLRPNLTFNILKAASFNFKNFDEFKLFEIGNVYSENNENKSFEVKNLGGVIASLSLSGKDIFYELKGVLISLFLNFGIKNVSFSELSLNDSNAASLNLTYGIQLIFHNFRSSEIYVNNKKMGIMGEVSAEILKHYDIKNGALIFFEFDFDAIYKEIEQEKEFQPFSKFPNIVRDLSVLIPFNTRIIEVEDVINNTSGELLFDSDILDIYEPFSLADKSVSRASGDEKFGGRKSLTFRLVFESKERTLTDKEVDLIMDKIFKALEENPEWEVRR